VNVGGLEKTKELIKSADETVKTLELVLDVSDPGSVEDMVKRTIEAFGGIDYGECQPHTPWDSSVSDVPYSGECCWCKTFLSTRSYLLRTLGR
jgi:hypothetical protein